MDVLITITSDHDSLMESIKSEGFTVRPIHGHTDRYQLSPETSTMVNATKKDGSFAVPIQGALVLTLAPDEGSADALRCYSSSCWGTSATWDDEDPKAKEYEDIKALVTSAVKSTVGSEEERDFDRA